MIVLGALLPHPPILLPEIGQGREVAAASTLEAYATVARRLRELEVGRLLMISTHGIVTLGRFHALEADIWGDFGRFGHSGLTFAHATDSALIEAVLAAAAAGEVPFSAVSSWEGSDHSIGVPIRLIGEALSAEIGVVSMSFRSASDHVAAGRAIGAALAGIEEPAAVIASGDAVHTLSEESPQRYHRRAAEVQEAIESAIASWSVDGLMGIDESLRRDVDESVVSPTLMLMGALEGASRLAARILASEHPWGVGYVTALIDVDQGSG